MDTQFFSEYHHQHSIVQRLLPAVVPTLLISVGYIDPGKWAAAVDGGARFGSDLILPMFLFNIAGILCQYLSAQIAVVTGKDLSQICTEEYDKATCIFLGVFTELSMVALELTQILGTAHVFNLLFGVDLCTCVFFSAIVAVLHHVFSAFMNDRKWRFYCVLVASFVLILFVLGVLFSQPENSISTSGMLTKLSGESGFALMSLLGASIMPHNFYLHSSIVQGVGLRNYPKGFLWHDHLFAIMCIFSAMFLVNYVLMSAAANAFYTTGVTLLTFQDALSLMDQLFGGSIMSFAFLLALLVSSQLTAFAWSLCRHCLLVEFFGLDIPSWLHHITIRIIAIIPALYCVYNLGAEGTYQILICTQVIVALVLPSSVIPLFRIASSKSIMREKKISQMLEFMCLITLIGMLGLKLIFLVEMIFGDSEWVNNLRWNMGNGVSVSYIILVSTALLALSLMLWIAATPLKSATLRLDTQMWGLDLIDSTPELNVEKQEDDYSERKTHDRLELMQKQEGPLSLATHSEVCPVSSIKDTDVILPETLLDSDNVPQFSNNLETSFRSVGTNQETPVVAVPLATGNENSGCEPIGTNALCSGSTYVVEKSVNVEGDLKDEKDFGSNKNLSVRVEECGSGAGSLSRLAGLGRAGRRQLASFLDEFWGQLFDFHGQATQEAKAKKLDLLLGIQSKGDQKPAISAKASTNPVEYNGYNSLMNSSVYNLLDTSYDVQRGPSLSLSSQPSLCDAYSQNYIGNAFDLSERRYSSLRMPSSYIGNDHQPATVHGYQIKYISDLAKQRASDILNGKIDPLQNQSLATQNYKKPQNGLSSMVPPGFTRPTVSRNISLQNKTLLKEGHSHGLNENLNNTIGEKKFYSSPDISKISLSIKESYISGSGAQRDSPNSYGSPIYSNTPTNVRSPLAYNDLSQYSSQFGLMSNTGSLFTKQPFEQFSRGNAPATFGVEPVGFKESSSVEDLEADLLRSFRQFIIKLLKLDGSEWLFRQNDGADEDLIERVAARERFMYDAETREINQGGYIGESQYSFDKNTVPQCGEECVWGTDLIISCGVWCIRRVLELSLMESRPELWGKYTYVLNRLQGIIDLAYSKPRTPKTPCFCLQISTAHQQKSNPPPIPSGSLPPPHVKQSKGKATSAANLLEIIKDVEIAISCRKGRSGTAAGDVAFPKGKENLASVLKRYKRRLANK